MELSEILALHNILISRKPNINTVLDINLVTTQLRINNAITEDQRKRVLKLFTTSKPPLEIRAYIHNISRLTSFENFIQALSECGYSVLGKQIMDEHYRLVNGTPHDVKKKAFPYGSELIKFYVKMKYIADNDDHEKGGKRVLELYRRGLDNTIKTIENESEQKGGRLQLLANKRVIIYALLSQKYHNTSKRREVLIEMRNSYPTDCEMTLFDLLFHSGISIICAAEGSSSAQHDEKVENRLGTCSSDFLAFLANMAKLYKNDIRQQKFDVRYSCYLTQAKVDFENCLQLTNDFPDEECKYVRTVVNLERAHALLGINWNFNVCDIHKLTMENLKQARDIISFLDEPTATRRKLWFYMTIGRQYELINVLTAKRYVHKAYGLARDENDKRYIKEYLTFLACEKRPRLEENKQNAIGNIEETEDENAVDFETNEDESAISNLLADFQVLMSVCLVLFTACVIIYVFFLDLINLVLEK